MADAQALTTIRVFILGPLTQMCHNFRV